MKVRIIKRHHNAQVMAEAAFLFGDFLETKIQQLRERHATFAFINSKFDAKGRRRKIVVQTPKGIHIFTTTKGNK